MRGFSVLLAVLPVTAYADIFQVSSSPQAVVVHPDAARVTREVTIDVPVGRHELRISDLPSQFDADFAEITVAGAVLETRTLRSTPLLTADRLAGTPEVQAAIEAQEAAQKALEDFKDGTRALQAEIEAARAQIAFLEGLRQMDRLAGEALDAAQMRALAQVIVEDGTAARRTILKAEAAIRARAADQAPLEDALTLAEDAFERIVAPYEDFEELSLNINAAQAGPVTVKLDYLVYGAVWTPEYRLVLDQDSGALTVERSVTIAQETGESWAGVDVSVTTLPVRAQSNPSDLFPRKLQILPEGKAGYGVTSRSSGMDQSRSLSEAPAPAMEEEFVIAGPVQGAASFSGAAVQYSFDIPVSITNGDRATLALADLSFDTQVSARAVPSRDDTAFRMVNFTNGSGERILAGQAELIVNGDAVGLTSIPTIEAGAEEDLGFGAIYGLSIRRAVLDREEGDRGIISRENRTQEDVRLVIDNLTERAWDVTLLDQVPYSEQEDLEITWQAQPSATRENVEDQRGLLEWDMSLTAGESQEVRLTTDIRWPDGQVLR
jgi:uncharacterized protein (TIGR02231 family)